mmetsp:Transcript_7011/g.17400  ORF Transcript_7011/g.17400 Transcript_7011/m.17400 type:complete len:109 (+) Transcript_7011:439-765(+)
MMMTMMGQPPGREVDFGIRRPDDPFDSNYAFAEGRMRKTDGMTYNIRQKLRTQSGGGRLILLIRSPSPPGRGSTMGIGIIHSMTMRHNTYSLSFHTQAQQPRFRGTLP